MVADARLHLAHARGELAIGADFVNESFIGTRFIGRLLEEVPLGDRTAVLPTVSPTLKTNRNRVSLVTTTARSNQIVKGFGVR